MSVFTESELEYLGAAGARRLARIATLGKDGTPHVVPVGFRYDPERDAIEVRGNRMAATKKFRDVERAGRAAIVVDDLASTDPWRPLAGSRSAAAPRRSTQSGRRSASTPSASSPGVSTATEALARSGAER